MESLVIRLQLQRREDGIVPEEHDVSHHVTKLVLHVVHQYILDLLDVGDELHQGSGVWWRGQQCV